ncbi:hypothetical protein ABE073_03830 [Lederbergia citrisecunda]|uniref:hypothetical protein n=1 Tax=Lederbergia citrisecunda TaxID=2833583 RepID=UPI003D2AE839
MAKIALSGATIAESTVSDHITYQKYEIVGYGQPPCVSWDEDGYCSDYGSPPPIYDWVRYTTSAKISGSVAATVQNVKIEGKAPIVVGDKTRENDSYTLPSGGVYVSGQHTGAAGSVTVGNANNVYVNGKLVALNGASVNTHAGTNTTINGGASTTVNIGG